MRNNLPQVAPPNLPLASAEYSPPNEEHYSRVLRLYFNRLNQLITDVIGTRGTMYLDAPYGAFSYQSNVVAVSANTAYDIPLSVTDYSNGVELTSSKYMVVAQNGLYNLQFSIQFANGGASEEDVYVWLRKDGSNVTATASIFTIPKKHGAVDGRVIGAANFFIELNAGEYVSLAWATTNTAAYLNTSTATTVPFISPASPAVVATLTYVSNLKA